VTVSLQLRHLRLAHALILSTFNFFSASLLHKAPRISPPLKDPRSWLRLDGISHIAQDTLILLLPAFDSGLDPVEMSTILNRLDSPAEIDSAWKRLLRALQDEYGQMDSSVGVRRRGEVMVLKYLRRGSPGLISLSPWALV
jgi:hypothetical protein